MDKHNQSLLKRLQELLPKYLVGEKHRGLRPHTTIYATNGSGVEVEYPVDSMWSYYTAPDSPILAAIIFELQRQIDQCEAHEGFPFPATVENLPMS